MTKRTKPETRTVMRAKVCRPCRGTGTGRFERGASVACVRCLGYGQTLYTQRLTATKVRA